MVRLLAALIVVVLVLPIWLVALNLKYHDVPLMSPHPGLYVNVRFVFCAVVV